MGSSSVSHRAVPLPLLLVLLLLLGAAVPGPLVAAFQFQIVPGSPKCFTEQFLDRARVEYVYRMDRSLSPFVSVAISAPGGVPLVEHEPAQSYGKGVFETRHYGTYAVCFNSNKKALHSATSFNITLELNDAEDSELTRNRKSQYSTSTPIALGAGKNTGALRQSEYVFATMNKIRGAYTALALHHEEMKLLNESTEATAWGSFLMFAIISVTFVAANMLLLRRNLIKQKAI